MFSYIAWKDDYFYWLVTYQFYWAVFWKEKKIETNEFNTKFNWYKRGFLLTLNTIKKKIVK